MASAVITKCHPFFHCIPRPQDRIIRRQFRCPHGAVNSVPLSITSMLAESSSTTSADTTIRQLPLCQHLSLTFIKEKRIATADPCLVLSPLRFFLLWWWCPFRLPVMVQLFVRILHRLESLAEVEEWLPRKLAGSIAVYMLMYKPGFRSSKVCSTPNTVIVAQNSFRRLRIFWVIHTVEQSFKAWAHMLMMFGFRGPIVETQLASGRFAWNAHVCFPAAGSWKIALVHIHPSIDPSIHSVDSSIQSPIHRPPIIRLIRLQLLPAGGSWEDGTRQERIEFE